MKKIAILGSAPSSVNLAPYSDPSWTIFGCSPGVYAVAPRVDAWFELHRWEPGVIGKAATQVPWFSPEYVEWMKRQPNVWMYDAVPEIPGSKRLPVEDLTAKYGTYFFTSSIAFMLACAIEDILEDRTTTGDMGAISLYGVDMAANEEYGYQRAGCQHFILLAIDLGIQVYVPPESDLLRPMPLYGISESSHWMIKNTARRRELENRLANATNQFEGAKGEVAFLRGALDDLNYQMQTWGEDRIGKGTAHDILARSPHLQREVVKLMPPLIVAEPAPLRPEPMPEKVPKKKK